MTQWIFVILLLAASSGSLLWASHTKVRVRYDGTEEPRSTFLARRALLTFEGIACIAEAGAVGAVFAWGTPFLIQVMIFVTLAWVLVPLGFIVFFPGIMSGRY
jgi:hypothetical protein